MQRMPLSTGQNVIGTFDVISVSPRVNRETGEIRTDRDNVPQFELEVLHRPAEETAPAEVVRIRLSASEAPEFEPMTRITPRNLTAIFWQFNDRAGVSLSCSEAVPARAESISKAGESTSARPGRQAQTEQKGSE